MHFNKHVPACESNRYCSRVAVSSRIMLCAVLAMSFWTAPSWLTAQEADPSSEATDILAANTNSSVDTMQFVLLAKGDYFLDSVEGSGQAMLGVHVRKANETLRSQLGVNGKFGLVVEHVTENSSAAASGLQLHDVLLKLDGQLLANLEQFQTLIDSRKPGDKVAIDYFRSGNAMQVTAELTERKEINVDSAILNLEKYHGSLLFDSRLPVHSSYLQFHDCKSCHKPMDQATLDLIEFSDTATDILGDHDKK